MCFYAIRFVMAAWLFIVLGISNILWNVNRVSSEISKYDNYTLIRLFPTNEISLDAITKFEDPYEEVEIMKHSRGYNDSLDILVPPESLGFVEYFAELNGAFLEIKQRNYGRKIEIPDRTLKSILRSHPLFSYNSYAMMQTLIKDKAEKNPKLVTLEVMGRSYEGRKMTLVKISANPQANNPVIFIDAGIHAREWVAPVMANYIINRLTNKAAKNKELDGVDWYILPVVNPDGYEYTLTGKDNRFWRKTRSKTSPKCFGVDGNRNFGYKWGVVGTSSKPCHHEIYKGPKAFSEAETRIVRDIMQKYSKRIKIYVSLHAYGQYLLYPWGYTGEKKLLPTNWKEWNRLAKKVSEAVSKAGGMSFKIMSSGEWYPASGGSEDYAFGEVGIPYSYTMEITDGHEFTYPEKLLSSVIPQFYEGFKVFGDHVRSMYSSPGGVKLKEKDVVWSGLHGTVVD